MPIRSNESSNERVEASRGSAADVVTGAGQSVGQGVQVERGASGQVEGAGESYSGGDQGAQGWQGEAQDSGLEQAVRRDAGSLLADSTPASQVAERQQADTRAAAGLAAQSSAQPQQAARAETEEAQRQRNPLVNPLDVSSIGDLGRMSKREDVVGVDPSLGASDDLMPAIPASFVKSVKDDPEKYREPLAERLSTRSSRKRSAPAAEAAKPAADTDNADADDQGATEEATSGRDVSDETGRPESQFNRPYGYNPRDRSVRVEEASTERAKPSADAAAKRADDAFKSSGRGERVYGKVNGKGSRDLSLLDVGVGVDEIMAVVEQAPGTLSRLFSYAAGEDAHVDVTGWTAGQVNEFLETHYVDVATFKAPNNDGPDSQRRRLRMIMREQRGIYLHQVMAKMYNADFDGDDMAISFEPSVVKRLRGPMSYVVNVDNNVKVDESFFPVTRFYDGYEPGKTARDFVREVVFSRWANIDGRTIRPLVDAVLRLCETEVESGDAKKQAIGEMFRAARDVASAVRSKPMAQDRLMAQLIQAVYDGMQLVMRKSVFMGTDAEVIDIESVPGPINYNDHVILKVVEGMVRGETPPNSQAFKVMMTGFIGDVSGKNANFRFNGDTGKFAKVDERLRIGNGEYEVDLNNSEQVEQLYDSLVAYAESRRMVVEEKRNGRSEYYTSKMRESIIEKVGFPEMYERYVDFLNAFCHAYARYSAMTNEANLIHLTNGGISSNSNKSLVSPLNPSKGGVTFGDLAEPLTTVYGNSYSIQRMFRNLVSSGVMGKDVVDPRWKGTPGHVTKLRKHGQDVSKSYEREYERTKNLAEFWVTGKYMSYSLKRFKNENRLVRGGNDAKPYANARVSDAKDMSDEDAEFHMLMAIADKRTGLASKFNETVYGKEVTSRDHNGNESTRIEYDGTVVANQAELIREIRAAMGSSRRDRQIRADSAATTLIYSSPEMFTHFNMDSPAGLYSSEWFKKMVDATDRGLEALGGLRTAMVFEYKMRDITALESALTDEKADLVDTMQKIALERDRLGSSSMVWHGILREFVAEADRNQDSVFDILTGRATDADGRPASLRKTSVSGETYEWGANVTYDAARFWSDPGDHTTLRSVIEDTDMDRKTKWSIITDVVRYWENDPYLKWYEVGYQLEVGNDAAYSATPGNQKSALRVYNDFNDKFTSWSKTCQEALQKDVNKAAKLFRKQKGALMTTLRFLDNNPWELIGIDDGTYADAILAPKSKSYAQTEKGQQHPWTNRIYESLCYQVIGRMMNDVTRTDDRVLGVQSVDSVGIADIVHLLADKDAKLVVYNKYSEIVEVTRESLLRSALGRDLSDNVEEDIWEYLQAEPRIAAAIRRHRTSLAGNKMQKGKSFVGACASLAETIATSKDSSSVRDPVAHVKFLMRNHPSYGALISLVSKSPSIGVMRKADESLPAIEGFRDESGRPSFLSNFYEASVTLDGITYKNSEAAFQAQKCKTREERLKFANLSGKEAKRLGRKVELRDDWEQAKLSVMRWVVHEKFSQNPDLAAKLDETRGRDLIEANNWNDTFWGVSNGNGENHLGKILMEIRDADWVPVDSVPRNERKRIVDIEDYVDRLMLTAARELGPEDGATWVLDELGVSRESLFENIQSDFDKDLESRGMLDKGDGAEERGEADKIYNQVHDDLERHIRTIADEVNVNATFDAPSNPGLVGVDKVSVASYWDVVQELSGAKTASSVGVEGYETWQFAQWASSITSRDHFADLEAVDEGDIDQEWDGAWTSLTNADGTPVPLSVDEEGNVSLTVDGVTYGSLREAREAKDLDEIVVRAPDAYQVQDRSTDYHGTPVSSLCVYMVSKRANGAEGHNLQAKKSGLDGLDSIIKMNTKYRMVDGKPVSFLSMRDELRDIHRQYGENGLHMARLRLAQELLEANLEFKYDDLTLSNYMCIAELMLVESDPETEEDGQSKLYLRSLEMLFSAIKNRVGFEVENLSDKQLRKLADEIVHDSGETAVGRARMDPADAFNEVRPCPMAISESASMDPRASSFARNYDLLDEIRKTSKAEPVSQRLASSLTKRYAHKDRGVPGVRNVVERSSTLRNYSVVGYAGSTSDQHGGEIRWTIGPSNAIVIGDGRATAQQIEEICDKAYEHGMTVVVSQRHVFDIPTRYRVDAQPCSDQGDVLIPMFDMRLNGSEASPYNGGRYGWFQAPHSRVVFTSELPINFFEQGDAQMTPTTNLTDRTDIVNVDEPVVTAGSLFPNVYGNPAFEGCNLTVSLASGDEIANLIANGVKCTIDKGVAKGGTGEAQRVRDVDEAIGRYQQRWSETNADGIMMLSECEPGDIVAWAVMLIEDKFGESDSYTPRQPQAVLAPIIPYRLDGKKKNVPERYTVEAIDPGDGTAFTITCRNVSGIENGFGKMHDSSGPANKGMVSFTDAIDAKKTPLRYMNGVGVDNYVYRASTASRNVGTAYRIKTMKTLMHMARIGGYNFAAVPGAFPDNPDVAQRLLVHSRANDGVSTAEWRSLLRGGDVTFLAGNDLMNAFLNHECRKVLADGGNPSHYLACVFDDESGVEHDTHVKWEFEAMFEGSIRYEDALLCFLNTMNDQFVSRTGVSLCPNGIDDDSEEHLFRLSRDADGYDRGILECKSPLPSDDGRSVAYIWTRVYGGYGFFGEDQSVFSRPNIDGASNFLDAMNTYSYFGARLKGKSARERMNWATSNIGRVKRDDDAIEM